MPLELSEMSLEEALRSYSSVKGHRTRVEQEIGNLLRLLSATYSSPSETRLNESLEKLQKHTHRLSDIAEYLASLKYAKARDHMEEVEDFKEILNKCSDEVFKMQHDRHVSRDAQPAQAAPPPNPRPASAKPPATELKPEKLTHDASTSPSARGRSSSELTLIQRNWVLCRVDSNRLTCVIALTQCCAHVSTEWHLSPLLSIPP